MLFTVPPFCRQSEAGVQQILTQVCHVYYTVTNVMSDWPIVRRRRGPWREGESQTSLTLEP